MRDVTLTQPSCFIQSILQIVCFSDWKTLEFLINFAKLTVCTMIHDDFLSFLPFCKYIYL